MFHVFAASGGPIPVNWDNGHQSVDRFHGEFLAQATGVWRWAMNHVSAVGRKRHDPANGTYSQLIRDEELAKVQLRILPKNRKNRAILTATKEEVRDVMDY
ncbi:MAG TPA: hypothetical protein VJW20_20605 [Candidatus Angelobacter sp.]|nr:hypothetical protein [Candidatus Angelobacter sp.]